MPGFAKETGLLSLLTPDDVARLSVHERLDLIGQLWDSLVDSDIPVTPAQRAELDRRLATFEDDRAHAVTWEELKAELSVRRR